MIEIRPVGYEDSDYDSCGSTTVAVLQVDCIKIPLCNECVNELNESLTKFNNTIFCHKCKHFIMSQWGSKYGGSCQKDGEISIENAGYVNCVDCMHTCEDAVLKDGAL